MSGGDIRPAAPAGQEKTDKAAKKTLWSEEEYRRFDARRSLGAITRDDILCAYPISPDTLRLWEEKGLSSIRPATKEDLYRVKDVQKFFDNMESFRGKSKRKQTRGKKAPSPTAKGVG